MKWMYFHLYVIMDIFSRYVVGWMVAEQESAELAKRLINETCSKQGIVSGQLTLHADRGTSMKSKPLAMLLSDLGVTKTHSRPHVSNDNPYSESQFKTLKYRPEFPKRFGSIQHARDVCRDLFGWYNTEQLLGKPSPFDSPGESGLLSMMPLRPEQANKERFVSELGFVGVSELLVEKLGDSLEMEVFEELFELVTSHRAARR